MCGRDHSAWFQDQECHDKALKFNFERDEIVQMACHFGNNFILTVKGELFAWGNNTKYNLGLGNLQFFIGKPTQVIVPEKIVQFASQSNTLCY